MAPTRDDWELESGLADDFDGAISDVEFGVIDAYAQAASTTDPMLNLHLECPEIDQPIVAAYSLGGAKQWEASRDSREVISAKNPDSHQFNMNSRAGVLVSRMLELVGGGDKAKGRDFFSKRGYMTQAKAYIGLNFHWKRQPMSTLTPGETRDVLMPNAYLGEASISSKSAASTAEVSEEDIESLIKLAIGKDKGQVKRAAVGEYKGKKDALLTQVFNKGLLEQLEADGRLVLIEDKYAAV